jgi:hypothetical protein
MRIDRLTVQNFKKFAGRTFQHLPAEVKANGVARLWGRLLRLFQRAYPHVNGQAKLYQVKQLLRLIERYNLQMEEEP